VAICGQKTPFLKNTKDFFRRFSVSEGSLYIPASLLAFYRSCAPTAMDEEECVLITPASEIMKQAKHRQARKKHKRTKRRIMRKFYAGSFAIVAVCAVFTYLRTFTSSGDVTAAHGRKLSGGHGCDYTSTLLKDAQNDPEIWGTLYLLVTLYWFIGIAIVCGTSKIALGQSPPSPAAACLTLAPDAPSQFVHHFHTACDAILLTDMCCFFAP
jgi:hypothetical protein